MFEGKSFRFKQAFGKVMLYTRMKRKMNIMLIAASFFLYLADLFLTIGIISATGWGCYEINNTVSCNIDLGFRWKSTEAKTTGLKLAQHIGATSFVTSFIASTLMIISSIRPQFGLNKFLLFSRFSLSTMASYFLIVTIVMYVGSYSRLKATQNYGYPNLVDDYGISFFATYFGWLILAMAIIFDGLGLVIPYGFESSTDLFLRRWLEKHYLYQMKKYRKSMDFDMPETDVQQL